MTDETRRWLDLITNARTTHGLAWLERSLVSRKRMTPDLQTAVTHRRAELEAEEVAEWRRLR